ncbi:MAG: ABC1 kinase family protein [Anaerolineae bacterium]
MPFRFPFQQQYQEIARARQIAEVLIKNGLGFLVEQFELTRFLPTWRGRVVGVGRLVDRLSVPQRIRHTIEELGPTFIKLGQLVSTRPDLLPMEYIDELSKLLDAAPPIPLTEVKTLIGQELGAPVEELFATFQPEPMAAASIGQAHRATLLDGQEVIVKVQRPGIEAVVEADLDIIMRQARFLEGRSELLRDYNLVEIVEEFSYALRNELDYVIEGRNADRFRRNFADDRRVVIPKVYWSLSTHRVLTLEELSGIKLNNLARLKEEGYDFSTLAEIGTTIYLKQIFVDGFFHADPHPANIFVLDGERIGLVDFGMVGYLTSGMKGALVDLFLGLINEDVEGTTQSLLRMGRPGRGVDEEALRRDVHRFLVSYYGLALEQIKVGEILEEVFRLAFRHRLHMPSDLALLGRSLIVLEGVARRLDPDFMLVEAARPFAEQLMLERLSPLRVGRDLLRSIWEFNQLAQRLPTRLDSLFDQIQQGEAGVNVELTQLEQFMARLDVVANRLAFSLIVAAAIIGSALIIQGGTSIWYLPFLGWSLPIAHISFFLAGLLGAWLLFSILRSRGL